MSDHAFWLGNLNNEYRQPMIWKGLFQAGSTEAIEAGDILEYDGTNWTVLDADQSMAGTIAFANEDIDSGDLAGYYEIIIPRPGDIFKVAINTNSAVVWGDELYWVSENTVTVTTGSNVLGQSVRSDHYPQFQNHLSKGILGDNGTTIKIPSEAFVHMTIDLGASYWAVLSNDT